MEGFEILECRWTFRASVEAGIHDSPVFVAKVEQYTFPKARAKNRNFQLLGFWWTGSAIPT